MQHRVSITVGNLELSNWLSYEIDGNILVAADAFSMTVGSPTPEHFDTILEGDRCQIFVDGRSQMRGVIDDVGLRYNKTESAMTLRGRSLAAYLVDCSAPTTGYDKISLLDLAKNVCSPWNIPVRAHPDARQAIEAAEAEEFGTLPRTQPEPGETCWDFLNRYAKNQGLMMWMSRDGVLVISKPNYAQSPTFSLHHHLTAPRNSGNNILSGDVVRGMADRYSHITVKAQRQAEDEFSGEEAAGIEYTATDAELLDRGIWRPLILTDYEISDLAQAKRRAEHEVALRRTRGTKIRYTVPWHGDDQAIYGYDMTINLDDELAGLNGTFYILGRKFMRSKIEGTRTGLTLCQRGALV